MKPDFDKIINDTCIPPGNVTTLFTFNEVKKCMREACNQMVEICAKTAKTQRVLKSIGKIHHVRNLHTVVDKGSILKNKIK